MIGKIIQGKSFKSCLAYVLKRPAFEILNMNVRGETANEMAECFELTQQLRPRVTKTVSHMMLSLSPKESLSDEAWTDIIDRYLQEMGFTNNFFVAVKHKDKQHEHVHLVASRIRCDGTVVSDSWERVRSRKIINQIEKDYGLVQVGNIWESDRQAPTISQIKRELETGIPTVKKQLADRIDLALAKVTNLSEFLEELGRDGIEAKISRNRQKAQQGISYQMAGVSIAGWRVGNAYSLPKILKRLEARAGQINLQVNSQDEQVADNNPTLKPTANDLENTKAFEPSLIAKEIDERAQVGVTMPQLIAQLKQVGIEPYVKYTRTEKVKGITYSIGNESIQGHELGKEYSWGGLQKYLQVSYDAERDNPLIKAMQLYDAKEVKRSVVLYQPNRKAAPEANLAEMAREIERLKSLQPPEQITKRVDLVPEIKDESLVQQLLVEQAHWIAAFCHEMLNDIQSDTFGEEGKNNYRITRDSDRLTIQRLKGDLSVILEMSGDEIVYANLHQTDIRRFENAWQLKQAQQQSSSDRHPLIP
jgi:hypothetical protein